MPLLKEGFASVLFHNFTIVVFFLLPEGNYCFELEIFSLRTPGVYFQQCLRSVVSFFFDVECGVCGWMFDFLFSCHSNVIVTCLIREVIFIFVFTLSQNLNLFFSINMFLNSTLRHKMSQLVTKRLLSIFSGLYFSAILIFLVFYDI